MNFCCVAVQISMFEMDGLPAELDIDCERWSIWVYRGLADYKGKE